MKKPPKIDLYTDGSTKTNPGEGGWGYVFLLNETRREDSGHVISTTNNRMEANAVIEALKILPVSCEINLYTDSQYVVNGIKNWNKWKARGKIKNLDLWEQLHELAVGHVIVPIWVKGHDGNVENERAHVLAFEAARQLEI